MRIVVGGISHETNVFSTVPTDLTKWRIHEGTELLEFYKGTKAAIGAFIDVAREEKVELIPTLFAGASPSGIIPKQVFDFLLGRLLDMIRAAGRIDGVLLSLHGGGFTEEYPDLEGEVLQEVREIVGSEVPIGSVHDFHSNITEKWLDNANVIVGYDTYPHIDGYERALEMARLITDTIRKKINPTMAYAKPNMIPTLQAQFTGRHPFKTILDRVYEIERESKVLVVWAAGGFPWSDFPDAGMGIIAITENDLELAKEKAKEVSDLAWSLRGDFRVKPIPVRDAIAEAMRADQGLYVLVDIGDNPGGGSPCDGTIMLKALLEMGAKNTVLAVLRDIEAVSKAIEIGVGNEVTMIIGGKTDKFHGEPIEVTGRVRIISDGKFFPKGPMGRGLETNLGRTVILNCNGVDLILTERRVQPTDLQLYRSLGIEPTERKILVVKSSVHYRAVHMPIAKKIIEVDSSGITSPRLAGLPFKNLILRQFSDGHGLYLTGETVA